MPTTEKVTLGAPRCIVHAPSASWTAVVCDLDLLVVVGVRVATVRCRVALPLVDSGQGVKAVLRLVDPVLVMVLRGVFTDVAGSLPRLCHRVKHSTAGPPPACWTPFHVVKLDLNCLDDVRRCVQQDTIGRRGSTGDPLCGIRRVLRRRCDRLSTNARCRRQTGLPVGDPTRETTLAWTVVQDLMALYQSCPS
jgi:hypothetical protein